MKRTVLVVATAIIFLGCQEKKEESASSQKVEKKQTLQVEQKKTENKETVSLNGESLFKAKGCSSCHQPLKDSVGPSLSKISKAYNNDRSKLINFLKGKEKPVVEPQKFGIMSPQLNTTKVMSDDKLTALADFILKH